ncbi:unnamed protein product [Polarella glacialis]|uniref:Uncharacterized protein n=1 Tax=Polarella glacialis TaxID=89957 RepID=A0A813EUP1_POLGL|nr:unnamed protein product [Polarella glacialis]CAE8646013.1 unnamed protein product [Polarella glacialis]
MATPRLNRRSAATAPIASVPGDIMQLAHSLSDVTILTTALPLALLAARPIISHLRSGWLLSVPWKLRGHLQLSTFQRINFETVILGAFEGFEEGSREVVLRSCCGLANGLGSREALIRAFEAATRPMNCDDNTVSQLTNGYRRIKEELARPGTPRLRGAVSGQIPVYVVPLE